MIDKVRRIVMAETVPQKSTFTHVDEVAPLRVGKEAKWWLVWGWDEIPTLPHLGAEPFVPRSLFPPPGGLRIWAQHLGNTEPPETEAERRKVEREVARLLDAERCGMFSDTTRPGMHRTDSIDIGVVVSGEVTTEADDGTRVVLGPGDIYIQNGALHNWKTNPQNPAHVVFILIGANRAEAKQSKG